MQNNSDSTNLGNQVLAGVLATLSFVSGEKFLSKITKHPRLVFSLGMITGSLVYTSRKAIIARTDFVATAGKHVVLEQKERFLDLVAETKEARA